MTGPVSSVATLHALKIGRHGSAVKPFNGRSNAFMVMNDRVYCRIGVLLPLIGSRRLWLHEHTSVSQS